MFIGFPCSPACAPSILITFINMVLFKNSPPLENCGTVYMFSGQVNIFNIQLFFNYIIRHFVNYLFYL